MNRRPFLVHVFLIRFHAGVPSYLLFQRRARPDLGLPDFWQGISGALEAGEGFPDAAIRETTEESSIRLTGVKDTGFEQVYPIRPEWRVHYGPGPLAVRERVLFSTVPPDVEPVLSDEHKSFRWCPADEAKALLTFGDNANCIRAVERCLDGGDSPREHPGISLYEKGSHVETKLTHLWGDHHP